MKTTNSQIAEELVDREAIRACLSRYCRGTDRGDRDMLLSAYWPGATDHHTGFDKPVPIEEFVEWALPRMSAMQESIHMITNTYVEIEGNTAKTESYYWSVSVLAGEGRRQIMAAGRYLDRFEKRQDEWRIAERVVVHDWYEEREGEADWSVGPFGGMKNLVRGTPLAHDPGRQWFQ